MLLTGSVAGRRVMPGSLYSATKWAVTAMSEAVRIDLNGTGIRTTLISPGGVETPFFDNPVRGTARSGRHRAGRALRGLTAPARGHQRDPRPPDGAGRLDASGRRRGTDVQAQEL